MEPVIISLVRDRVGAARLAAAARGLAAIEVCGGPQAALRRVAAGLEVAAVILDIDLPDGRPTAPLIAALRARHPAISVTLYGQLTRETGRRLLEAVKAGATDFVLRDVDDDIPSFRVVLQAAMAASLPVRCTAALLIDLPAPVRPILTWCLTNANAPLAVDAVARGLRLDRSTLDQRLRTHRLPSLRVVIAWSRLVHVAHRLDALTASVAQIAGALRFPSATALHNQVRRYTGHTPQSLRDHGAVDGVVSAFANALSPGGTAERLVALPPPADHTDPGAIADGPRRARPATIDVDTRPALPEGDSSRRAAIEWIGEADSA